VGGGLEITSHCMAYTNHTLLPEALERWPVALFERLLPRPLEIIYEINARFLREVAVKWPGDIDRRRRMSIIERVMCGKCACVAGHRRQLSVNGVAALHSKLLREGCSAILSTCGLASSTTRPTASPAALVAHANPSMSALISSRSAMAGWRISRTGKTEAAGCP